LFTSTFAELLLTESRLLVLLGEGAESAAAREGKIGQTVTLEVVLLADVGALNPHGNPVKTNAGGASQEKTRGVHGLIALHGTILASTVMGLAECDARETPGDQAGVDGVEAAEEASIPLAGISSSGGCNLISVGEGIIEASFPVINIVLVDGAGLGWCTSWSRHCDIGNVISSLTKWVSREKWKKKIQQDKRWTVMD